MNRRDALKGGVVATLAATMLPISSEADTSALENLINEHRKAYQLLEALPCSDESGQYSDESAQSLSLACDGLTRAPAIAAKIGNAMNQLKSNMSFALTIMNAPTKHQNAASNDEPKSLP